MDKPDNPVVYICSYLKKEYPEAFSVVEGDKAKVQETIDPLSDDDPAVVEVLTRILKVI